MAELVYVTEDDDSIRELVTVALSAYSYETVGFVCAEDALKASAQKKPDIYVFDIMLPGMDGLQAVKTIRSDDRLKDIPVLMLTAKSSEIDKVSGLENGADDYLTKPFGVMELAARIKALLRRTTRSKVTSEEGNIELGNLKIDTAAREVSLDGVTVQLTLKEFELLLYLVRNHDKVVSRDELLAKVCGIDFVGETRTLDMHIRTLRKKLGDDAEDPHLIKTIRGVGYRFIGE